MISKSISKIAKMASKMPDYEQQFTQFCWDILIKLKLPGKVGITVINIEKVSDGSRRKTTKWSRRLLRVINRISNS